MDGLSDELLAERMKAANKRAESNAAEVLAGRQFAADYVNAQGHHMSDAWRSWFMKRFRLEGLPPYGVRLQTKKEGFPEGSSSE